MSSNYPGALDVLPNPAPTDDVAVVPHSAQHTNANDAIEAVQATLGIAPAGAFSTVVERLDDVDAGLAALATVRGTVTFDFGVGGAAAARQSIADVAVTAAARVTYGVRVPTSRSLDELEFAPLFPGHQVNAGVGIDLILVCMGTATGQFQLDYEYSR